MNKTVIILFLVLLSLLVSKLVLADEQRLQTKFTSQNQEYTMELSKGSKWRLKNKGGKVLYSIKDEHFTSMTMWISNDGQQVVVVDDFSETRNLGQMQVLWFFYQGQFKKSYQLQELLTDTCNVSHFVWHTRWCLDDLGFSSDELAFRLSTYEFYDFEFDTMTGNLKRQQRPEGFTAETIIVYGSLRGGKGKEISLKVFKFIVGNGKRNDTIQFKTDYYREGPRNDGVMIQAGQDITPMRYRRGGLWISDCLPRR
jgi:hypothetical protein